MRWLVIFELFQNKVICGFTGPPFPCLALSQTDRKNIFRVKLHRDSEFQVKTGGSCVHDIEKPMKQWISQHERPCTQNWYFRAPYRLESILFEFLVKSYPWKHTLLAFVERFLNNLSSPHAEKCRLGPFRTYFDPSWHSPISTKIK